MPFVTSLGVGAHLETWGVRPARITELDWWETMTLPGSRLSFTATPARHFSGRGNGSNRTAWSSWSLRSDHHGVFFSGDTGLTKEFETIHERCGKHDLVMLEVGAYHPSWGQIHLGPDNALIAHRMLGGGALLPVHWGSFDLGLHPWSEPLETLTAGAAAAAIQLLTPRPRASRAPTRGGARTSATLPPPLSRSPPRCSTPVPDTVFGCVGASRSHSSSRCSSRRLRRAPGTSPSTSF